MKFCGLHSKHPVFLGLLFLFILFVRPVQAQEQNGIPLIDKLLAAEKYTAADSALQSQIKELKAANDIDSLAYYPYYVGKIRLQTHQEKEAAQAAEEMVDTIKMQTDDPEIIRKAYLELALFYGAEGMLTQAYKSNEQALLYTQKMKNKTEEELGVIENNLGVLARRMGNVSLSNKHHRAALSYFQHYPKTAKNNYYITYNNMGAMMWFSSRTDSALYYYDKALEVLNRLEPTPFNRYYRTANLLNNKAALLSISGKTTQALAAMKTVVQKYNQFLEEPEISDAGREGARQALFRSIENLAGIYKELGNYSKTRELLEYSYHQKQKYLDKDNPGIFKVQILFGQIELALKNYDKALQYLHAGIAHIQRLPDEYLFWHADACASIALLFDEQRKMNEAAPFFEQAETLYKKAFDGGYDAVYLDFLANEALFYAEKGDEAHAVEKAQKVLNFTIHNQGANTLSAFKYRLNLASVYYKLGRYREAAEYSRKSLSVLQGKSFKREYRMDSVQVEFKKPEALLLQAKAEYQLNSRRDTTFLIGQLYHLDDALAIIDKRKMVLSSGEDVNIQIANNTELFDFAKKIALELYQKTGNKKYLNHTIGYHESGIYNRIRTRLNVRRSMHFASIPDSIRTKEAQIKDTMEGALAANDLDGFIEANTRWEAFLEDLKASYPRYFALRYASIKPSLSQITEAIPEHTTVIRYFFVDKKLYALLLNQHQKRLVALDFASVRDHINLLHEHAFNAVKTGRLLHDLYQHLWEPFANDVETRRVVIIPDKELFNLSFETLLRKPIQKFTELSENSLLSRYAISYRYSLFLLDQEPSPDFKQSFVAFAPGFDEDMKHHYVTAVNSSVILDHTYLTLLPQPFTIDLVFKLKDYLGGNVYTGEESTEQKFISAAGRHNIIHIGTHAESNNLNPELSRLFFAKNMQTDSLGEDNSLYAYQIYNYDLSSNLTLLTACDTGKPHYQPGEGMISLAHAFSYAGSKSLLTSLWNIDEKSSSQIVDLFYKNLLKGMTKDVALQRAKRSYLKTAEGRTAAPEYWAGLVILGDAGAISIERSTPHWPWLFAGLILLVVATGYLLVKRRRS